MSGEARFSGARTRRAGFVLAGGRSSRMGRDKALLPFRNATLVEHIAAQVLAAAGNVTLIGPPERYPSLACPVVADRVPDHGPLGGLHTALAITPADWNLIVACDMPDVTADFLAALLEAAESADTDCLVPETSFGREPLCAVYHRRCLPAVERAVANKLLKMQDFVSTLRFRSWPVSDSSPLKNINRPEEWQTR